MTSVRKIPDQPQSVPERRSPHDETTSRPPSKGFALKTCQINRPTCTPPKGLQRSRCWPHVLAPELSVGRSAETLHDQEPATAFEDTSGKRVNSTESPH